MNPRYHSTGVSNLHLQFANKIYLLNEGKRDEVFYEKKTLGLEYGLFPFE